MFSDVSQCQCTQKCIAECVDGNVAVRVSYAADRAVNLDASKPERKSLSQSMYVITLILLVKACGTHEQEWDR